MSVLGTNDDVSKTGEDTRPNLSPIVTEQSYEVIGERLTESVARNNRETPGSVSRIHKIILIVNGDVRFVSLDKKFF